MRYTKPRAPFHIPRDRCLINHLNFGPLQINLDSSKRACKLAAFEIPLLVPRKVKKKELDPPFAESSIEFVPLKISFVCRLAARSGCSLPGKVVPSYLFPPPAPTRKGRTRNKPRGFRLLRPSPSSSSTLSIRANMQISSGNLFGSFCAEQFCSCTAFLYSLSALPPPNPLFFPFGELTRLG